VASENIVTVSAIVFVGVASVFIDAAAGAVFLILPVTTLGDAVTKSGSRQTFAICSA